MWCMEQPFDILPGVHLTTTGYVSLSSHDHLSVEAVEVLYCPDRIGLAELIWVFLHNIDLYDGGGQFSDRGTQYRTAVAVHNILEKQMVVTLVECVLGEQISTICTSVVVGQIFQPSDAIHQDYYLNCPVGYSFYVHKSNRKEKLIDVWRT